MQSRGQHASCQHLQIDLDSHIWILSSNPFVHFYNAYILFTFLANGHDYRHPNKEIRMKQSHLFGNEKGTIIVGEKPNREVRVTAIKSI